MIVIKGFLAGALISAFFLAGYLANHLGVFDTVTVGEETRPPFYVIFQNHKGAYYQISDTIMNVERVTVQSNLDCPKTFGQYFDDPNAVDEDRLRSRGGCISEKPYEKAPADCEKDVIPAAHYVSAHFNGSPAIGPWKVYPRLRQYVTQHRLVPTGGSIEIYTLQNDKLSTEYLFPVK